MALHVIKPSFPVYGAVNCISGRDTAAGGACHRVEDLLPVFAFLDIDHIKIIDMTDVTALSAALGKEGGAIQRDDETVIRIIDLFYRRYGSVPLFQICITLV